MIIKIKKNDFIDTILLSIMFAQLIILEFFGFGGTMNKLLAILLIARMIFYPHKRKNYIGELSVLIIFLFVFNLLFTGMGRTDIIKTNFLVIFYPYIYMCFVCFLCKQRPEYMNSLTKRMIIPLNIIMVVNIVVLILQIQYPNLISAVITTKEIDYYEDTVSGLFEYGSTHIVCLFTTAVVLFNFSVIKKLKGKKTGKLLAFVTLLIVVFIFGISTFNDNKAIYVILPIALLLFWLAQIKSNYKRIARIVLILIGIVMACILSKDFYAFLDDNVFNVYKMSAEAWNLGTQANGSNERIAIIMFALAKLSTWLCGTGFGNSAVYAEGYLGFKHFGQADLGSIMILGGIWFTIVLIYTYIKMLNTIAKDNKKNKWVGLGIAVIFILSIIYTQCITRTNSVSCQILIALAYRNLINNTYTER